MSDAPVTQLMTLLADVDAQLFPGTLPVNEGQDPSPYLPAVVLKQVGGPVLYSHDGPSMDNPSWEFRCWAKTYADAKGLASEVVDLLEQLAFAVHSEIDHLEPTTHTWDIIITADGYLPH